MNTRNPTAVKRTICHLLLLNPHRPSLSKPLSSISFRNPPPKPSRRFYRPPIRAYSQNPNPRNPNHPNFQKPTSGSSLLSLLTTIRGILATNIAAILATNIAAMVAAAAISFAPFWLPPVVETSGKDSILDEEKVKLIEEHLASNPNDVDGLKNLMEVKIKSRKIPEAIDILDRLMELEPEEVEWPMWKAHVYALEGEFELAKNGYNELLKKDPFRVEVYHMMAFVASQESSSEGLRDTERRVGEAIELCKEEGKNSDLRDFKLLRAQIRVLQGSYNKALKVCKELVKEEPRYFRPYLCQGIIYTLLRKNYEAEESFEKYRSLAPEGHPYVPYGQYINDNTMLVRVLFRG